MNTNRLVSSLVTAALILVVPTMSGQEVSVGGLTGGTAGFLSRSLRLVIDWSRPATATGTVNTATVGWAEATAPCDGIFYVGIYAIPTNALVGVKTAERGPFRAVNGLNTVSLDPPMSVNSASFIGIRRTDGPDSCGQVAGRFTRAPNRVLTSFNEYTGGPLSTIGVVPGFAVLAQASSGNLVRVGTLPVVGSVAGSFDSFFRTSLAIANPSDFVVRGKFILRPAGRAGSVFDPSLDYEIPPRGTLSYPDILVAMNQTGLGSLDIYTTESVAPIVSARVFNDTGATGTSGFSEEAVPAGAPYANVANILVPADSTNFRLNVGVRTISACDLTVVVYDAEGDVQVQLQKSYPANYFEQVTASAFLNGAVPSAGGRIVVSAFDKEFIVYGAVTDNRTNDPSLRIGLD